MRGEKIKIINCSTTACPCSRRRTKCHKCDGTIAKKRCPSFDTRTCTVLSFSDWQARELKMIKAGIN